MPTKGEAAKEAYWNVRVPISFMLSDERSKPSENGAGDTYAKWEAYVPGPRTVAPWTEEAKHADTFKPDAMLAGQLYTAGNGLRLLTPPGG